MKTPLLSFFLCFYLALAYSQTVTPTVIAAAGGSYQDGDVSLDWTVGELAITKLSDGDHIITQGFHQPPLLITSTQEVLSDFPVKVYPNPTTYWVNVELPNARERWAVQLYDQRGLLLFTSDGLTGPSCHLTIFDQLPSGSYVLRVSIPEQQTSRSFNIVKTN